MPFRSEKQRRFLFANKPEIAEKWAKEEKKMKSLNWTKVAWGNTNTYGANAKIGGYGFHFRILEGINGPGAGVVTARVEMTDQLDMYQGTDYIGAFKTVSAAKAACRKLAEKIRGGRLGAL